MAAYQKLVPDAAERIFRMAEVATVDKSKRLDLLAAAEIDEAKSDRSSATAFLLLFLVAAVVFFSLGNNFAGGILLGLPVLQVIRTLLTKDKSSRRTGGE